MRVDDVERRLAAILSADVAGYGRLMAEDEPATVRTITTYRNEICNLVGDHRGRVVDATGDNALAEFPTALNAVECAVEIQRVLKARNAGLAEKRRMEFRIGVHLGDVTVEGERIYGDGVNIAARLQGLATPGGICISGAVHEQVESKLGLGSEDLGKQTVKNIPKPVRVFRVYHEPSAAAVVTPTVRVGSASIVVLPFANMSSDPEQEYFCDGMAEEVINALTQLEDLHVVARTSAFSFKGRDVDVREIGEKLGVRSVLEGSVRKAGDRLRVTAQLINVADGYHLWSERFDRQLDDVFAIQDEIASMIVATIKPRLLGDETTTLVKRTTHDLHAYDLYLLGRHHWNSRTAAGMKSAVRLFGDAIDEDPDFSLAHAGLADSYALLYIGYGDARLPDSISQAKSAAQRALAIDSDLAEAHNSLAYILLFWDWDWAAAESEFQKALKIRPNYATAHQWYAQFLWAMGRWEEGNAEAQRALELDPLSVVITTEIGWPFYFQGQYDRAVDQFSKALEMDPDFPLARYNLALTYVLMGRFEDAIAEYDRAIKSSGGNPFMLGALGHAYAVSGVREKALDLAHQLEELSAQGHVLSWEIAEVYVGLGDWDRAFEWLESSYTERHYMLPMMRNWPEFHAAATDPRYQSLIDRMRFPD